MLGSLMKCGDSLISILVALRSGNSLSSRRQDRSALNNLHISFRVFRKGIAESHNVWIPVQSKNISSYAFEDTRYAQDHHEILLFPFLFSIPSFEHEYYSRCSVMWITSSMVRGKVRHLNGKELAGRLFGLVIMECTQVLGEIRLA